MNQINCLITTAAHRRIAEELGLNPAIVTNYASMFISKHPGVQEVTKSDIKALIAQDKNNLKKTYLAIPIYTKPSKDKIVKRGKPLTVTHNQDVKDALGNVVHFKGEIELWRLPEENGVQYFFDYISGVLGGSVSSQQMKRIIEKLINEGHLRNFNDLRQILQTNKEIYQFVLWKEMSHKQNKTTANEFDKEYQATLDALNKAKDYKKFNPQNNTQQKSERIDYYSEESTQDETTNEEAIEALKKLGVTLDNSLIDSLLGGIKSNNPYHQLFKQIVEILKNNGIPINVVIDPNLQGISSRTRDGFKTATIKFNPRLLLKYLTKRGESETKGAMMRIVTHELVHAVTAELLDGVPIGTEVRGFDEAQAEFATKTWNLWEQCKEQLKGTKWYGLKNAREFVAEALTNRKFQAALSEIKVKKQSAFKRFINYLTKLFNKLFGSEKINIKDSVLEEVVSISQEYFEYANKGINRNIKNFNVSDDAFGEDKSFEAYSKFQAPIIPQSYENKVTNVETAQAPLNHQSSTQTQNTSSATINIYAGTNENADLSNFAVRPFTVKGSMIGASDSNSNYTFDSVEKAFQAAKVSFAQISGEQQDAWVKKIQNASSSSEARSLGRKIPNLDSDDWNVYSSEVMKDLIKESFKQNPKALERLLSTGNATLTHNQDPGKWGKEFPKLLMEVREELRGQQKNDITIPYTPKGKEQQIYTIRGNKIFNKNGEEVFKEDSVDRNKIFANLAVRQGRAVAVDHKGAKYIVNNRGQIISGTTGEMMQWGEDNSDRKAILADAATKLNNSHSNNKEENETKEYKTTDEFRKVQEGSRNFSKEGVSSFQLGKRKLDDEDKERIGGVLGRLLGANSNGRWHGVQSHLTHTNKDGSVGTFNIGRVDGELFHDIFETVRTYLPNGELVDLHLEYDKAKCFVTEDGLCGFAIEPDGNLISVFSLSPSTNKGFLYAIKDIIREEGATHLDTYMSDKQPLQKIYAKTLGFHTASTMDYNMEYDHDDIAKNHNNPQVVFMVNHEVAEPKHFDKNSYDSAQEYQLSLVSPTPSNQQVSQEDGTSLEESNTTQQQNNQQHSSDSTLSSNNFKLQMSAVKTSASDTADSNTADSQDELPGIGVDRVKVDTENPIFKTASAFTSIQRRDRANLIARMFSDLVTGIRDDLLYVKEKELAVAEAQNDKVLQKKILETIERLKDPVKGRQYAIKHATVRKIVEDIQNSFKEMLNYADDEYTKQQYQNVLDNFEYLLNLAKIKIERNEHLKLALTKRDKYVGTKSEKVIGGDIEQAVQNLEDNDREQDDDDENGNRATGNDGWSFKVRMINPHSSLSKTTKRILSNLIKLDNISGEPELDDLGNVRYLDEQFAHAALLNALSDMVDDKDFCIKEVDEDGNTFYSFPLLEQLKGRYKWVQQVINELCDNPSEVSAFYADFRKDFIPYWKTAEVTEEDNGETKVIVKSIPLNLATGFESAKNQFIDNYESGTQVDENSIYDTSRKLNLENITLGLSLLGKIDLQEVDDTDYNDICEDLAKIVRMLGLPTTAQAVRNIWDSPEGDQAIRDIYNTLAYIYGEAKRLVGNDKVHLISKYSSSFNKLAGLLGEVTELDTISSFRNDDKSYYSYSAPNYLNTQIKQFKSTTKKEDYLATEFKTYSWFYDNKNETWKGSAENKPCWLELIETNDDVRANMQLKELLVIDNTSYEDWTPAQIKERFITEYFSIGYNPGSTMQYGYYNYPIFSDSPIAMLIKMPRYTEKVEDEIIPRLRQVVKQELERIKLVEDRAKNKELVKIANFDSSKGRSFCFFSFLNSWKDNNGTSFRNKIAELKSQGIEAVNKFIDDVLSDYMEEQCENFINEYRSVGQKLIVTGVANSVEDANNKLKEYFYNHQYAQTQIIQMTTTDLAFYKDGNDFQKRFKEVYASGTKLNTQSQYGREFEKTVYLSDQVITSRCYTDIKSALMRAKDKWIKDGLDEKVAQMSLDSILEKFKNINVADAQAYRSPSSMRAVLDMMGLWNDSMQKAFDRIQNGEWDMSDFNIVWQTIKPFVYTQIGKDSGVGGTKMKVPHQNKNSEFLLLAAYSMIANSMSKSPQLVALNEFMEKNNIDVVQFESAVKAGKQGCIDISYSQKALEKWIETNPKEWDRILDKATLKEATDFEFFKSGNDQLLDEGKISQEEYNKRMDAITPTKEETLKILQDCAFPEGAQNDNVVHTIPYKDYMIAQPNPPHLFDEEQISTAVYGSQFRNLIISDISKDAVFTINGKKYRKQDAIKLYDSLIVENLLEDFQKVQKRFSSIEDFQKALLDSVRGNDKYGKNLLEALQLVDWTDPNTGETKKVFNVPIYSPSIATQIQSVVTSMFKNAVTKQTIKGAACVLVSDFGFTDKLNIKYKKDGDITSGVEYVECYLPWYSKQYFEPFLKEVTKNGVTYQEVDITKVPKDLLEMVGYRIPTENKYSMVPLKVVGFLPQQNGNSIMLPADITQIAGSDFDVDKLFMMMPEYRIENYNKRQAIEDFKEINSDDAVNKLIAAFTSDEALEESTSEEFNEWWEKNKEKYKYETPKIHKIKYNTDKDASQNSRAARNNMLIDISKSILQHTDTADKFLNPGSFDKLKKAERLATIMNSRDYLSAYVAKKGIVADELLSNFEVDSFDYDSTVEYEQAVDENRKRLQGQVSEIREALKKETLDSLDSFLKEYKTERDPLSLDTFIYYHQQNTTGDKLIGVYANNTTLQAKYQNTGIALKTVAPNPETGFKGVDNAFYIDGKQIKKLDQITSPWGERISKNCAEFSAASVDNVKDPVLAKLMQNPATAKIACFMLRAGIPVNIISLFFNQPIVKRCIEETGGLSYSDFENYLPRFVPSAYGYPYAVTSDELMDTIILQDTQSDVAARIGSLMLHIVSCATSLEAATQISRADSPNGAIGITFGGARSQVQAVTQLLRKAGNPSFKIEGLSKTLIKNNKIKANDSIDSMRTILNDSPMSKLQAFYSLGIELPLQVMAPFFVQLNSKLDASLNYIYQQANHGSLPVEVVEQFYKDYIEYMLTESTLFGTDDKQTFDQKRDYYLYKFPEKFYDNRLKDKFKDYDVIQKIVVKDGDIRMKRGNRVNSEIEETFTTDFDSMISSDDAEVVQMAIDLFMYSFYKNGFYFSPTSFGRFFSPLFIQSFPEFIETLRGIEQKVQTMDMSRFLSQFFNNYWADIVTSVKNKENDYYPVRYANYQNLDTSDIFVPFKKCVNKNIPEENPYDFIKFNDALYCIRSESRNSKTTCTYYRVLTFRDEQGRKYNAAESLADMVNHTTDRSLIEANKRIGAKKVSFEDLDAFFAMDEGDFEALDALDLDNVDFDALDSFGELDGIDGAEADLNSYNLEDGASQLKQPLCK